ncbi:MAG: hypothetical protein SFU98_12570 [Leptospiraceae bacterium]|nr:hypothetical protein [Leptospiraceae bacterium]
MKIQNLLLIFLFIFLLNCRVTLEYKLSPEPPKKENSINIKLHRFFWNSIPNYILKEEEICPEGKITKISFNDKNDFFYYFTLGLYSLTIYEFECGE